MNAEEKDCIKNDEKDMETSDPEPLTLPRDQYWDVYLAHVGGSTNYVLIRFVGEEYSDQLHIFENALEEEFRKGKTTQITVGMVYVAYTDDLYHRVKVLSVDDEKITCFFLDHGDVDILNTEDLRPLDKAINRKLPYQIINASLHGLGNVSQNETALTVLSQMALGRSCVAEPIVRYDEESIELVLYDTNGGVDININEEIIQQVRNTIRKSRSRGA
ncbi:hypothetical protein ACJMK2_029317 [Sinanodonta woodiana]|uniref:Tudor domain-containing protein n=1 Tax=Sinanodonta woodiana TaxID=1069815 RepID=A0ABD3XAB5_SINWO